MKVYEKIKSMGLQEMKDFLESVDVDSDHIYCCKLCPHSGTECDSEFDELPCKNIDTLQELLNAEYDERLFKE